MNTENFIVWTYSNGTFAVDKIAVADNSDDNDAISDWCDMVSDSNNSNWTQTTKADLLALKDAIDKALKSHAIDIYADLKEVKQ